MPIPKITQTKLGHTYVCPNILLDPTHTCALTNVTNKAIRELS